MKEIIDEIMSDLKKPKENNGVPDNTSVSGNTGAVNNNTAGAGSSVSSIIDSIK
jgi:hypothetical protein